MRHIFTIVPDDFDQKRVFLSQRARQETLPATSKMSRTARDPPPICHQNGLQTHKINSGRKYPIHRNNLYVTQNIENLVCGFFVFSFWVSAKRNTEI